MSTKLRDLIQSNDFTGYQVSSIDWKFEPDRIEEAIYGMNGSYNLPYDLVERFANAFKVEVISINTWTCTDTPVGLEVLRMQGIPIGLVWQSARKAEQTISFFDKAGLRSFQTAWESMKSNPDEDANFIPDALLDMPIPGPDEKILDLQSGKNCLPALSPYGAADWIERQGGLEAVTDKAALGYIEHALIENIEHRDGFLNQLREREKEMASDMVEAVKDSFKELEDHRAALDTMREEVRGRILKLP